MIASWLSQRLDEAIKQATAQGLFHPVEGKPVVLANAREIALNMGDFSSACALKLGAANLLLPNHIAQMIVAGLKYDACEINNVQISPKGYINIWLGSSFPCRLLLEIHRHYAPGKSKDKVRYYLHERQFDSIKFGETAGAGNKQQNLVFIIEHALARLHAAFSQMLEPRINIEALCLEPAFLSESQWQDCLRLYQNDAQVFYPVLKLLYADQVLFALDRLYTLLAEAKPSPDRLFQALYELAEAVQEFFNHGTLAAQDKELSQARPRLVCAARLVISDALSSLGLSAPEHL